MEKTALTGHISVDSSRVDVYKTKAAAGSFSLKFQSKRQAWTKKLRECMPLPLAGIVVGYALEEKEARSTTAQLQYDPRSLGLPGSIDASLVAAMKCMFPLRAEGVPQRLVAMQSSPGEGDQGWQKQAATLAARKRRVPHPMYEWLLPVPGVHPPHKLSRAGLIGTGVGDSERYFEFAGALFCNPIRAGNSQAAFRTTQANHAKIGSRECKANHPSRTQLPTTSLIVTPSDSIGAWLSTLLDGWPACRVLVVKKAAHLLQPARAKRPTKRQKTATSGCERIAVVLENFDVVLLSHTVFLQTSTAQACSLRPRKGTWNSEAAQVLLQHRFNTLVVDEAHLFLWKTRQMSHDETVCVSPATRLLLSLGASEYAILLTATPGLGEVHAVPEKISGNALQYAAMLDVGCTGHGSIAPHLISMEDLHLHRQYTQDDDLPFPGLYEVASGSPIRPLWRMPLVHAFLEHAALHFTSRCAVE